MEQPISFVKTGQIVDVVNGRIYAGRIEVDNGVITRVEAGDFGGEHYIMPGLIDAHVHIESSMLLPSEFARLAVVHGTVGSVSDPHEIANVLGIDGVKFMIANGKRVPFHFAFGAPSCVPATPFETSGAVLDVKAVEQLLDMPEIKYLSEMMNFPGVLHGDPEVMAKLKAAQSRNKVIDGHAPGLKAGDVKRYAMAGITTDHECFTLDEAREKAQAGMKILVREGSAARNFDALIPLIKEYPDMIMLCSDDKHPDELVKGHINLLLARIILQGYNFFDALRAATLNPVMHYGLEVGLLRKGDKADFIITKDLMHFEALETYIGGLCVARNGKSLITSVKESTPNQFNARPIQYADLQMDAQEAKIKVIHAMDGQLITERIDMEPLVQEGRVMSDPKRDILKIMVLNRYQQSVPALGFVSNFGLREGAIASTVAHDSHNIICVGANDNDMVKAVNLLIENKGGIAVVQGEEATILPLPVAGIMSEKDGYEVAAAYEAIDKKVKALGSKLSAPFMTLSFMALLVIPSLKLSDRGLFDGNSFSFTENF